MNGKTAVVLGAGPGLGMALAQEFAEAGYHVVPMARDAARLAEMVRRLEGEGLSASCAVVDCASNESIRSALAEVVRRRGGIDVLVYNTAVLKGGLASEISPEELVSRYQVDVAGAVCAVQEVLPSMRGAKDGAILLTGGGLALAPVSAYTSISVHKAALRAYALALNAELAHEGIFVGIVNIRGNIGSDARYAPEALAHEFRLLAECRDACELTY